MSKCDGLINDTVIYKLHRLYKPLIIFWQALCRYEIYISRVKKQQHESTNVTNILTSVLNIHLLYLRPVRLHSTAVHNKYKKY